MHNRITSLLSLGMGSILAAAACSGRDKPNVVIILADDMGYGDVSFDNPYSRTMTPNIDNIARSGIAFTNAHSGGAVSIPSRYGILTGRYYFRLPAQKAYFGYLPPLIEESRMTIGSLMQNAGYTTACVGKWHLGLKWKFTDSSPVVTPDTARPGYTNTDFSQDITGGPHSLGFNYSFIIPASLDMAPYVFVRNNTVVDKRIILTADKYPRSKDNTTYVWDRKHTGKDDIYWERGVWWRNGEMSESFRIENCLDVIVDEGIGFINDQVKNNPGKPFMLYLPLTGPHTPWMPDEKFIGSSEMGRYGDFVSMIDDVVRRVNETLESLNISDNTILIFASDNGAHWAENDIQVYGHQANWKGRGQKSDIWNGGHHIPLFVKWPSVIKNPFAYDHPVSLVDIFSTLAEMTGQTVDKKYAEDSFSFYGVLKGNKKKPVRESIMYISGSDRLAIEKDGWKFIDCLGSGGFTDPAILKPVPGGPAGQLYNLSDDPLETLNLYLKKPDKVSELSGMLRTIVEQGYSRK